MANLGIDHVLLPNLRPHQESPSTNEEVVHTLTPISTPSNDLESSFTLGVSTKSDSVVEGVCVTPSLTLSRPLSSLEANWAKSTARGSGTIIYGTLFDVGVQPMEPRNVFDATRIILKKHPLLRARIVQEILQKKQKPKLYLQIPCMDDDDDNHNDNDDDDDDDDGLDPKLFLEEKPWPILTSDELGFRRIVEEELNIGFASSTPSGGALGVFKVVWFYGNASEIHNKKQEKHVKAIIVRLHNAIFDITSAHVVAKDLIRTAMKGMGGLDVAKPTASCDVMVKWKPLPSIEELLPKSRPTNILKKGMDTAAYIAKARNWCLLPFHTLPPDRAFQSHIVSLGFGLQGTSSLLSACNKEGIPYQVVLATSFLKTARSIKGLKGEILDEFAFSCVMDCRKLLEPSVSENELGNFTLSLLMSAKIKEDVEFWDLARHIAFSIQKDVNKGKQFSRLPLLNLLFSQVLKYPSMTPNASCRTMLFTLSTDNYPNKLENEDDIKILGVIGPLTSVHHVGPCFLLSESLHRNELVMSFVYPSPLYSRDQMMQFLSSSIDLLHQSTKQLM